QNLSNRQEFKANLFLCNRMKLILLLIGLALPLLEAGSSKQLRKLYWHSEGLEAPVLVRKLATRESTLVEIDPVMLVRPTENSWTKRYDPIAKQAYIDVPVWLTVKNIEFALRSEISVKFAAVTDVTASMDPGSVYNAFGFVWSQGEEMGVLRLGCSDANQDKTGHVCNIDDLVESLSSGHNAPLRRVLLKAEVSFFNRPPVTLEYRLRLLNTRRPELEDYSVSSRDRKLNGQSILPYCAERLRLLKSIRINNGTCSAMVYEFDPRMESRISHLVEEPICFSADPISPESIQRDPSDQNRWTVALKMLIRNKNNEASLLAEVVSGLSKFGRKVKAGQVKWMALWRAQRSLSGALLDDDSVRVGELRLPPASSGSSRDGNGEVELHCRHEAACRSLAAKIQANPVNFWRHIRWQATFLVDLSTESLPPQCVHAPEGARFAALPKLSGASLTGGAAQPGAEEAAAWRQVCRNPPATLCRTKHTADDRNWIVVQQRRSASLGFDRPWADYVRGFGDGENFWIGLTALHMLTTASNRGAGVNLRIQMTFWNGTEAFAEYTGFQVAGHEANFSMTYSQMSKSKSSVFYDALADGKGAGFSTYDRDRDRDSGSCSQTWGRGGWWFGACYKFYPNGLYPPGGRNLDWKYMKWASNKEIVSLSSVLMMVQI
ncbi:hypothetical protein BOX15_Mlig015675g2, partial [Macrostomum lignano]